MNDIGKIKPPKGLLHIGDGHVGHADGQATTHRRMASAIKGIEKVPEDVGVFICVPRTYTHTGSPLRLGRQGSSLVGI